ncbi:EamA family transporter [Pseudonocardia sp.]|uniref:EamA family transporter n=1 Tax=Pseudonocardia sp. TaxID=60912 RepID=UPI003D14ACFF
MSVPAALPSAVFYGVGDFTGGLAARRAPVLTVTFVSQVAGLALLLPALVLLPGAPSLAAAGFGVVGGLAGATGVLLYFRGLAVGPMGVVAPLSAVVGAGLPLAVGLLRGERPGALAAVAIAIALTAICCATAGSRADAAATSGIALGLAAGLGFGLFFVAMDAAPADSGLWPLAAGRVASVAVLAAVVAARRPGGIGGGTRLAVVSGIADTVANVLFLVATRIGDLGISAVLVSLYPVVVVLLARTVLRERLTPMQLAGTGLALTASALLAGS